MGSYYSGYIQLTPDNSNPRKLKPHPSSNKSRFPLDFLHTFTVILLSVTWTLDKLEPPANSKSFLFPFRSFVHNSSSITRTMFWVRYKSKTKQRKRCIEVRNIEKTKRKKKTIKTRILQVNFVTLAQIQSPTISVY